MQAEVAAVVATAQQATQQGRVASASAHTAHAALHSAQAHAQKVTGDFLHDFYERKIFDPYLTFGSAQEEQAYREREEARQRAIEAARALGTPEGELLALRLSREQLQDAARFGADRSPDFAPTYATIVSAGTDLEQAMAISPDRAREDQAQTQASPSGLVSPDIIASLRNAGISVPASDALPSVVSNHRACESGRLIS